MRFNYVNKNLINLNIMKNKEDKCGVFFYIFFIFDIGVYDYEVIFLEFICFYKIVCKYVKKK